MVKQCTVRLAIGRVGEVAAVEKVLAARLAF
jgi:hypothetical protein